MYIKLRSWTGILTDRVVEIATQRLLSLHFPVDSKSVNLCTEATDLMPEENIQTYVYCL